MFFRIGPLQHSPHFSFIICKHPDSVFEREIGGRKVKGQFDAEKLHYVGYVATAPLDFLNTARTLNMSNYVHVQPFAVCPHNLAGFDEVFRSALRGKNPNLPQEDFDAPILLEATLGPFPSVSAKHIELFEDVGIHITPDLTQACMVHFQTTRAMSVTEFLQKLYLLSFYTTIRYSLVKISTEQIEKFVHLCSNWLSSSKFKNAIVNTLCRHNKTLIQKFEISFINTIDNEEQQQEHKKAFEEFFNKKDLHTLRHELAIAKMTQVTPTTVVDLGCGRGQLIKRILKAAPNARVLGIEGSAPAAEAAGKMKGTKVLNGNIVRPNLQEQNLLPDMLFSIEVIEHLEKQDRVAFIQTIKELWQPKAFVLSTPNIAFNVNWGMPEGELRHPDHKIEYTQEQFEQEVVLPLSTQYDIEYLKVLPEEPVQPSFVIFGTLKLGVQRQINYQALHKVQSMHNPVYLSGANYTITPNSISAGYASSQMRCNPNIFYLAPTIAPVEYNPEYPDVLEHPATAVNYYMERGVHNLVAEHKYMGSRAYVLLFKNATLAALAGFNRPIIINSRQGFPFFSGKEELLQTIYEDIRPKLMYDFVALDCEITPWAVKAAKLIKEDFLIPGQCAQLLRSHAPETGNVENAQKYLDVLAQFTKDEPTVIHPFQVICAGEIHPTKRFARYTNGLCLNRLQNYHIIDCLESAYFKPVERKVSRGTFDNEVFTAFWQQYCENGGEGIVIKPYNGLQYQPNGSLVQPALKVRSKEYLRIIYGMDYLEEECFDFVKVRQVKYKRALALKEFELSLQILRCFLNSNAKELARHVGAFIGMENNVNFANIDATL